jgi:transcriptional regulator with XRE-family HTH domain
MNKEIGNKIKRLRQKKRISLRELEKLTGYSHSYISYIENGNKRSNTDFLEKVANALNVDVAEFFIDDDSELQEKSISPEWIEVIDFCKKENIEPKKALEIIQIFIKMKNVLKDI